MNPINQETYDQSLVRELAKLPNEAEWVEFKHNNADPKMIGEYISALANSAAILGKNHAYVIWGIDDKSHELIGTSFSPQQSKMGNEELENWLLRLLAPKVYFEFREIVIDAKNVVLLEIRTSHKQPVQFEGQEYIRVGSYKKKLKDFPEKERELWRVFENEPFETQIAKENITLQDAVALLDYPAFFELIGLPLPLGIEGIGEALEKEKLIVKNEAGYWGVTNLGAMLIARSLQAFPSLKRKALRVIIYEGNNKLNTLKEQEGDKGYASGFEGIIQFINSKLPANEIVGQALRKDFQMFPELSIRELVANAIIHQDFTQAGNGPMVEIFENRMEITNPGTPFVEISRLLDAPPRSRNEGFASMMRRFGICEERGSGIDKVVIQTEIFQLPPPVFEIVSDSTRSILFSYKELTQMDKHEKVHATYLHSVLRYLDRSPMTNASLRERFKIDEKNSATVSRIIKDAVEDKFLKPFDVNQSRKHAKYLPFWAG